MGVSEKSQLSTAWVPARGRASRASAGLGRGEADRASRSFSEGPQLPFVPVGGGARHGALGERVADGFGSQGLNRRVLWVLMWPAYAPFAPD